MAVRTGPQPMPGGMPPMPGIMGAPMGPPPGMPGMGGMPGMPPMQQPMPMPMGGPLGGPAPQVQGGGRPASLGTLPAPSTAEQRAGFGAAVGAVVGGPVMGALPSDVFAGGIPGGMMDGSIPRPVAYMQGGGVATAEEQRLGINKDISGQVIGRSMNPEQPKTETQAFVSEVAPGWMRSDIYDATVNALEAGKPLENYRIEGRGTQGTLTIVFDDGTRVPTGFRDSKDVRAHADAMVKLANQYQASGIGQAPPPPAPPPPPLPQVPQGPVVTQPDYGGGGTSFVQPYTPSYVAPEPTPVPVSQPGGGIMNALPGSVLGTVSGPMMGSVYQPTVSSIPTFVGGVSDVFGTRPVTYVGSPQATIRSRIGEIDLPARPQSINIFDFLSSPVAGYGGLR